MKLFDLDGTLTDSNRVWVKIDEAFLKKRGFAPDETYYKTISNSIFPIAAQFTKDYYRLPESVEDIMEEWRAAALDAYSSTIPLKAGVRAYLDRLQKAGEPMAVVTSCHPQLCRAVLERHGILGHFGDFVFAHELGIEKRDPRLFAMAAKRLKVAPEDCVMYEDALTGCQSAKAAGLFVVGVYDAFNAANEAALRAVCDRYIMSFEELL